MTAPVDAPPSRLPPGTPTGGPRGGSTSTGSASRPGPCSTRCRSWSPRASPPGRRPPHPARAGPRRPPPVPGAPARGDACPRPRPDGRPPSWPATAPSRSRCGSRTASASSEALGAGGPTPSAVRREQAVVAGRQAEQFRQVVGSCSTASEPSGDSRMTAAPDSAPRSATGGRHATPPPGQVRSAAAPPDSAPDPPTPRRRPQYQQPRQSPQSRQAPVRADLAQRPPGAGEDTPRHRTSADARLRVRGLSPDEAAVALENRASQVQVSLHAAALAVLDHLAGRRPADRLLRPARYHRAQHDRRGFLTGRFRSRLCRVEKEAPG